MERHETRAKRIFRILKTSIYNSHYDPKGIQGDLNTLDYNTKFSISNQSSGCFENIDLAIRYENLGQHKEAIECWKKFLVMSSHHMKIRMV